MNLLSYDCFKKFSAKTALSVVQSTTPRGILDPPTTPLSGEELAAALSPFDVKRLESYAESMLDYHVVLDLVPRLAEMSFTGKLGNEGTLSVAQQAIILALGLQRKPIEALEVSQSRSTPLK